LPSDVQFDQRKNQEPSGEWHLIPQGELSEWNARLFETDAHLHQYPFWNEPLGSLHLQRDYLVYRIGNQNYWYICILSLGVPALRIGFVRAGPVSLLPGVIPSAKAFKELLTWCKQRGYIFVRFSHSKPEVLEVAMRSSRSERTDPFPFYAGTVEELIVNQVDQDAQVLAGFQAVARRNIKHASAIGYEITAMDLPASMRTVESLVTKMEERKGRKFYRRSIKSYQELLRLAKPHNCCRLYVVALNGKPVQTILIARDRDTAHYILGALDVTALNGNASPSCLVHWRAMREFSRLGTIRYSLGGEGSGNFKIFKHKFRPRREVHVVGTLILRERLYRVFCFIVSCFGAGLTLFHRSKSQSVSVASVDSGADAAT
jgi:hypothetical protein